MVPVPVSGFDMLLFEKGNLHDNVVRLRQKLDDTQELLDKDPYNVSLRENEARYVNEFNKAALMEERFLKQKAKIQWLKEGDSNSAYFLKVVKSRISHSRIDVLTNTAGVQFENDRISDAFVSHYEAFIGQPGDTNGFNTSDLFRSRLDDQVALYMVWDVTREEVNEALFLMGDDKAPGPDGFTTAFFKKAWDVVANEVTDAVCEFFVNGKLLKELNHTIIALIPKVQTPTRVNDYRPISCCNVLFKCISKIIGNRIKHSLKVLVSPNQSAFVPGRSISDNILLTQEFMHNYHLDRGAPRYAFKVDIQKAYDTIMECVTTTLYSISINGALHEYFHGKRGLRQGDPLSPYLFTLIMEILTLMLQRRVANADHFYFHRYCSKLELINLCFADDLFLFAHGDANSAGVIRAALDEFKEASGLVPSLPKSTAYFCNVLNHVKLAILNVLPFEEGRLPVKYLGVPLVSSRLLIRDCKELVERIQLRIQDWKNKYLSIAGRLQLIRSVLGSMHIFWASVFILPSRVLNDLEQHMRGFLWGHSSSGKPKSKVAWDSVCLPKDEGGLGIRRLDHFNSALMVSHVWKLISLKESLWVKWIHEYKLKRRSFWDIPMRGNMTWGWRKMLQIHPLIREFIWSKVGNGSRTSLWFDKWCDLGPLSNMISNRDIHRAGLNMHSTVKDIIVNGTWVWPQFLNEKYTFLSTIPVPLLVDESVDQYEWRNSGGHAKKFSVSIVWDSIRPRDVKVTWFELVWFNACIPRHSFNLWLIMKHKLKTQDRIQGWDVSASLPQVCALCDLQQDSHEHLFFDCPFSKTVWDSMKGLAGLNTTSHDIYAISVSLFPIAKQRTTRGVIAKLVLAACAYFLWQERNWRLFKKLKRSSTQIIDCIKSVVRLKLLSCRFKKSRDGLRMARLWDLPAAMFSWVQSRGRGKASEPIRQLI
ncbi:putative RNA-directed DNA polymerase [Tanacetum coccineum]